MLRFGAVLLILLVGALSTVLADSATDLTGYVVAKEAAAIKFTPGDGLPIGHLGVNLENANGKVKVVDIEPGSPAFKSALAVGDFLLSFNGEKIPDRETFRRLLSATRPSQKITLVAEHAGEPVTLTIQLAAPSNPLRDTTGPAPKLGVQLQETEYGMRVEGVTPGTPAAAAGLKPGDVLQALDGFSTRSLAGLRVRLGEHAAGDRIKVQLLRDEKPQEVTVELVATAPPEDTPTLAGWDDRNPRVFRGSTYKLAVIPIQFDDHKLNERLTPGAWDTALFSKGKYKDVSPTGQPVYGSMNDFYQEMSYGKFKIEGKVFDGVTVSRKRAEYLQLPNRWALQNEACDLLLAREGDNTFKTYDGIFFIFAGSKVATQRGGIYWPHRSKFRYRGKSWDYFICPEGGDRMSSISVISHEFGHMLGLPDLYGRPEAAGESTLGVWCTMSTGHGQDGRPLHFCAWCKEQLGWLCPVVIDPHVKQRLILSPVSTGENECYKVLMRPDGQEYLLLENRRKRGFDRELPGEGMLIWRVVHGRPVLEESHGIGGPRSATKYLGSIPYPSPANRAFTPDTTPSSRPTLLDAWQVYITHIRQLPDGRIAFQIGYEYW